MPFCVQWRICNADPVDWRRARIMRWHVLWECLQSKSRIVIYSNAFQLDLMDYACCGCWRRGLIYNFKHFHRNSSPFASAEQTAPVVGQWTNHTERSQSCSTNNERRQLRWTAFNFRWNLFIIVSNFCLNAIDHSRKLKKGFAWTRNLITGDTRERSRSKWLLAIDSFLFVGVHSVCVRHPIDRKSIESRDIVSWFTSANLLVWFENCTDAIRNGKLSGSGLPTINRPLITVRRNPLRQPSASKYFDGKAAKINASSRLSYVMPFNGHKLSTLKTIKWKIQKLFTSKSTIFRSFKTLRRAICVPFGTEFYNAIWFHFSFGPSFVDSLIVCRSLCACHWTREWAGRLRLAISR